MKTDTQIMNEIALKSDCLHILTAEESCKLKGLLLDMYKDISSLCDKNGLIYMLGGGSCLGAVRHNGFIPWDDDLDLMMPRESYERLIELLSIGALGDKYEYSAPNKGQDCKNCFLKIYRCGTVDEEITSENIPGPKGIYVDVFPMDYAPAGVVARRIKGFVSDLLHTVCSCVLYTEYPSELYKRFMSESLSGRIRYCQRMILGRFFGIIPHRKWVYWFDQWSSNSKDTGYLTVSSGRKHYWGECRTTSLYLPVSKAVFEGIEVNLPNQPHEYLVSMYGNYMELPPVEKRERHFVYRFQLPND